jgi:hypothetical protein
MRSNARADPEAGCDAALHEDPWRQRGLLGFPDLYQGEDDQKRKGERKQRNDTPFTPLYTVRYATHWDGI